MDKVMLRMVVFGALAIAILLQVTTAQKVCGVGENMGWTIPLNGAVVFNFATGRHNVQEVSKTSFEECSKKDVIGKSITTGPTNVTLESPGDHYYICTVSQHCLAGQKLAITVSSTGAPTSNTPQENAPRPSSSTVVFASFLLSLSSIALALFL